MSRLEHRGGKHCLCGAWEMRKPASMGLSRRLAGCNTSVGTLWAAS